MNLVPKLGVPKIPRPSKRGLWRRYYSVNTVLTFLFNQVMPVRKNKDAVPSQFATLDGIKQRGGEKPQALGSNFRIATWNVEHGHQLDKLAKDLPTLKADLLLLQEVPVLTPDSAPLLAEFGAYYAYAPGLLVTKTNPWYSFSNRGQLTLTSVAPAAVDGLPLPKVSVYDTHRKHRFNRQIVLYTQLKTAKGTLGVYNIHLDNYCAPTGRRRQLNEIFEQIRKRRDTYVIVAGDFNTVYGKLELVGVKLQVGLVRAKTGRTCGLFRLDHILYSPNMIVSAKVIGKNSSDHKPIVADVQLL
jgi:endonuclease/exonuclease/phosphatase family metal-dependent hydrolase